MNDYQAKPSGTENIAQETTDNHSRDGSQSERRDGPGSPGERNTPPKRPAKERRIGTITMGICLILTGVLLLVYLVNPNFDLLSFAQFAPVILIMIGTEILYHYFAHRGDRFRYDFLSIFFCTILIFCSFGLSVAVPLYKEFGPANWPVVLDVEGQVYDQIYSQLSSNSKIGKMYVNVQLYSAKPSTKEFTYKDMTSADYVDLTFHLNPSDYADTSVFAQDCSEILNVLKDSEINIRKVTFRWNGEKSSYSLQTDDRFSMNQPAEKLAALVENRLKKEKKTIAEPAIEPETVGESGEII